jgi:hypothetical protein
MKRAQRRHERAKRLKRYRHLVWYDEDHPRFLAQLNQIAEDPAITRYFEAGYAYEGLCSEEKHQRDKFFQLDAIHKRFPHRVRKDFV